MGAMDRVTIGNGLLAATIAAKGAELQSLIPAWGGEMIWSGDPAIWGWHAPNLFPIIGALTDDALIHQGRAYLMKQHGFLRHSVCEIVTAEPDRCLFRLTDSDSTRAQYPFAFDLTIGYRIDGDALECAFTLRNPAETPLYASIGAHPGFAWPLSDAPRDRHIVAFGQPEPEPIRRLAGRTLDPAPQPTPVDGRILRLDPALFDRDALIFDKLRSRSLIFGAPGAAGIALDFADFPQLGVWSKLGGAPFLCLEPWQGYASLQGFAGEFSEKPGVVALAPGEGRNWRYAVRPVERVGSF
jgi:galactose mutarotase-like enzyme